MRLSTAVLASAVPGNDHRLHLVKIVTGTPCLRLRRPPLILSAATSPSTAGKLPFKPADLYGDVCGQQDKAAGMMKAMPARGSHQQQAAQGTRTEHAFTGNASDKWDNAMENKDAVLFGNEPPVPISTAILG
ncbi:hypothetical protein BANRA_05279 [Klebsiella pneumoniae]|nr:hypothetical protein BANRA_05279 [Klebsiella pneumoniae]